MKYFILIIPIFFAAITHSFSQLIISGTVGDRALVWDDFTGTPDAESPYHAYTYWHISYKWERVKFKTDTVFLENLSVELSLDPQKSWLKKGYESDKLLKHEQGHFDIGHLCMVDFENTANHTTFFKNDYKQKMQSLFVDILNKYKAMSEKYDEETKHSEKKKKQEEWTLFIESEMKRMEEESKI